MIQEEGYWYWNVELLKIFQEESSGLVGEGITEGSKLSFFSPAFVCQHQIESSAFLQNRNFRFFNINNIVKSATVSRDGLPGVSMEL